MSTRLPRLIGHGANTVWRHSASLVKIRQRDASFSPRLRLREWSRKRIRRCCAHPGGFCVTGFGLHPRQPDDQPHHAMSQLEYLIALVSIIVGLALADLAGSFRELVRPRRAVRWHWLPLTWAAIVLLLLVQFWWTSFGALQEEVFGQAVAFLPYLMAFLVLYLACAFALPDPECRPECAPEMQSAEASPEGNRSAAPEGALDMKAFYFSATHRRWFFGALIVLIVLGQVLSIVSSVFLGDSSASDVVGSATANLTAAALLGALMATNRWWVHAGGTLLVLGVTALTFATGLPILG